MIAEYPIYPAVNSNWTLGTPSQTFFNYETTPGTLGYQAYPSTQLVNNPNSLGGYWFSTRKKKHNKKSKKSRKKNRKSKKNRKFGSRVMTPGGMDLMQSSRLYF